MRSIGYFFKEALINFKRNFSTALGAIVTIFLSLLIIGVFLIASIVVNNIMSSIESEVSITCYVSDDASQADIATVQEWIGSLDNVKSVSFTTKEQALENFRKSISDPEIVDQLDDNPLPASIDVELEDPQQVESVANQIVANSSFAKICDSPDNPTDSVKYGQETVSRLFTVINYVRYVGLGLVVLLIFVAFVFINNTIRLAILARRKEISIMRLVGASNGFIRGPFLMEGAIQAVIGALLAIICLIALRTTLLPKLTSSLAWLPVSLTNTEFVLIFLALIGIGLLIGVVGSALAMRRYLKV